MATMNMRGSLNVSKFQKTPAQPRFYGKATIHGVEYTIKGWEKDSPSGPWISLMFEDPLHGNPDKPTPPVTDGLFSAPMQRTLTAPPLDNLDDYDEDDIPF